MSRKTIENLKGTKPKDPPANNAGSDVIDEDKSGVDKIPATPGNDNPDPIEAAPKPGEVYEIPDLPHDMKAIAETFFLSGYWPKLDPAKIAVQIMAGRSLDLDPAQAMFDLNITAGEGDAGPTIQYRDRQSYLETRDRIDAERYGRADGANDDGKTPAGSDDRLTPGSASPTADRKSNVVELPYSGPGMPQKLDIGPIADDLANKGPLTEPAGEMTPKAAPGSETTSAAQIPASAAAINEGPNLSQAIDNAKSDPFASTAADPDPAGLAGDTAAIIATWRERIAKICDELEIKDRDKRLKEFDGRSFEDKKKQFDAAEDYYSTHNRDFIRARVLTTLKNDNKTSADEQKGFFLFAEVPLDPDAWTLADATKADAALVRFRGGSK